jgi:8-oxo-dGTP pyrophosphatase MutT (NUDIX family)
MCETYLSPRTGEPHPFYLLETADWTNIIPLTPENDVVLIRQFRPGIRAFTLEIPGGLVDPTDASPMEAARREMREETGYDSERIVFLGSVHPNPAILNNCCSTFLATDVHRTANQQLDSGEDIEVESVPLRQIPELIRRGKITHGLVLNAFQWLWSTQSERESLAE